MHLTRGIVAALLVAVAPQCTTPKPVFTVVDHAVMLLVIAGDGAKTLRQRKSEP